MSEFKEFMDNYGRVSSVDDMERLSDVIDHLFCYLKDHHPDIYHKYITKVKLTNKHAPWDKEQAELAVSKMKNKDGSEGEHWNYDQTSEVLRKKGYDHDEAEWYYVLNMVYSDYYSPNFSTDIYVELACDIIDDIDVLGNATKRAYIAKHFE